MADWSPKTAEPVDDWQPQTAMVPVKAHARRPRIGANVGGMVGGLVGTLGGFPGKVAGAGIGGSLGEQLQQGAELGLPLQTPFGVINPGDIPGLVSGELPNPQEVAKQGLEQATYEAAGQRAAQGLGAVGKVVAKPLMAKALAPAKTIVKNFPTVVEDALRQGASVGRWFGKGGAAAADRVRTDATGKVLGLLRAATSRGERIDIDQVAAPAVKEIEKKLGRRMSAGELADFTADVQARADELLSQSVMGSVNRSSRLMNPLMADELRKAATNAARSTLATETRTGIPQTAIPDIDRFIVKGAANAVKGLRGVGAAREAEKRAIGVARAVTESELRPAPADVGLGLGPVKMGLGLPPGAASRLALISYMLNNPMTAGIAANMLRAGGGLVNQ